MLRRHALKLLSASLMLGALQAPALAEVPKTRELPSSKLPVSVYLSMPPATAKVVEGFVNEFQQTHPYLEIQVKNFPRSEELYQTLTSPNKPVPTMAIVENSWLPGLVQNQPELYPVEAWMPKEQFGFCWAIKNNAQIPLWEASHVNGQLYALPYFFTTKALIYNPNIMLKAGIKQVPTTWEQVLAASKKISDPKATPPNPALSLGQPDNPGAIARNFQMLVWQTGGEGVQPSTSASNPLALQSVLEYLKKVQGGLAPLEGTPLTQPVGMYIGNVEDYFALRASGLPVKTSLIPGFDKTQRISETQGWALAMFKGVPERELYKTQELAFYLVEFQQQLKLAQQTPYLAAHLKVFDNPFYRRDRLADHSNLRVFLNSVSKSRLVDTSNKANEHYSTLGKKLAPVLRGEKTWQDLITNR